MGLNQSVRVSSKLYFNKSYKGQEEKRAFMNALYALNQHSISVTHITKQYQIFEKIELINVTKEKLRVIRMYSLERQCNNEKNSNSK